jgi:hypothetical protein
VVDLLTSGNGSSSPCPLSPGDLRSCRETHSTRAEARREFPSFDLAPSGHRQADDGVQGPYPTCRWAESTAGRKKQTRGTSQSLVFRPFSLVFVT